MENSKIIYHNRNTKIYIINSDIPQEWFNHIRRNLYLTNNSIFDKKLMKAYLSA